MNTLDVIVGGQFGSESKGRVTADIAAKRAALGAHVIGVRVAGPNAGHVVIDHHGNRFALRQLPVALVSDPRSTAVIAAGSEIDPPVLLAEIDDLERAGHTVRNRLIIDPQATVIEPAHHAAEGGNGGPLQNRIGSTGKGIGAARADRIWRKALLARDVDVLHDLVGGLNTADYLNDALSHRGGNHAVVIEGTQGFGLGLHAGYYPQCTSSDCRAIDFLAMAGVNPWVVPVHRFKVWVVLRPYPIRVAGNSGPLLGETTWTDLGLPDEHTTVTHKVRRVGEWDPELARAAVHANGSYGGGVVRVALAMADQVLPELAGHDDWTAMDGDLMVKLDQWCERIEDEVGAPVASVGTGPATTLWRSHELDPPIRYGRNGASTHAGLVRGSEL